MRPMVKVHILVSFFVSESLCCYKVHSRFVARKSSSRVEKFLLVGNRRIARRVLISDFALRCLYACCNIAMQNAEGSSKPDELV